MQIEDNVVRIAAGKCHVLALTYKGALYGWGSNKYGQLALSPKRAPEVKIPQLIAEESGVKMQQVFAGKYYTLAIGKNDALYFWGSVRQS